MLFCLEFDMEATIKGILKNFAKFTGKHLYQSLFFSEWTSKETNISK